MHDLARARNSGQITYLASLSRRAARFRYSSRAAFLDGLQLSRAAFEIGRYRDLRFRSGKAVLGSIVESYRCISSRLSIARTPFSDVLVRARTR